MYLPGGEVALDTYIICIYHTGMQNGCRERHSSHDSPLNYNLTLAIVSLPKWIQSSELSRGLKGVHDNHFAKACMHISQQLQCMHLQRTG